ncbi:putative baseplate assembly protein [Trichocoleus sp. FACHB-262]|uniref:putative baseplate assembly protein n=1 Tax=Trichocoleus sp. FACHB-262 TaxID=2692869 RepID=UPI001688B876|nr:putative baseplate assembly protein [Trichocoleus sp. FACHB-262]MBD2120532.1 putative baseplate assembly protein [Trichocoleus sp. FACHB-262]
MDFDFLPQLPKSNLDDRTFKDLVDECLLRIPRYCPEWTHHNPSDPGVTLIELFAWLTDQMLLRFNQVPRRQYVAFLELLGINLQPPAPAHTVLSFYLTRPQDIQRSIPTIPAGAEVATQRTETEMAIVFSTDQELPLGVPWIRHFLTEETAANSPQQVRDRLSSHWTRDNLGRWTGRQQAVFQSMPQAGDSFYLVFDGAEPLDGAILALTIEGEPAGSTGINPNRPPRCWEAWNGEQWQSVLLKEDDDGTRGFSFNDVDRRGQNGLSEADVILHLPLVWAPVTFAGYYGRWLRCSCLPSDTERFSRSPQLTTLFAQNLGGRALASQCARITNELVGESNGTPGQTFFLQSQGILERQPGEYLQVTPPGEPPQCWTEVENFSASGPSDRHYTLDSRTGRIQFGPLIREPNHLQEEVQLRRQEQWQGQTLAQTQVERVETLERQYGATPARDALLHMVAYRTGGGDRGNVPRHALRILKTALPYVKQVTNHEPARDGANAENLEEAVLRVPRLLRTRNRAVTAEDYETLTLQASRAVGRAYCPKQQGSAVGIVSVYVVPRVSPTDWNLGMAPETFTLSSPLRKEIEQFLGDRCLLGTQVQLRQPDYVGVSVQAVLGVEADYRVGLARRSLRQQLTQALYQLLNPLTGGRQGTGWEMGAPLYLSDLVRLLQNTSGVQFLETIQLFELRSKMDWQRQPVTTGMIDPGPTGVICSWAESGRQSAHRIQILGEEADL